MLSPFIQTGLCYPNEEAGVSATEVKRFVLLAALAILATACGVAGTGGGSNPSPSSGLGFDVTATEKDRAVTMHTGQKLEVVLHGGGQITYQQIRTSDASILEPTVDPAATAVRGVTLAAFKAVAPGQVEVTAVGAPVCPSGQACPMFAVLWSLEVTVLSG
jgi:hypothetical protein